MPSSSKKERAPQYSERAIRKIGLQNIYRYEMAKGNMERF